MTYYSHGNSLVAQGPIGPKFTSLKPTKCGSMIAQGKHSWDLQAMLAYFMGDEQPLIGQKVGIARYL